MALLVFLTFLSLITNQYVPVWMTDAEASHMGDALGQVGKFKSDIDLQILAAQTAHQVRRHYIPVTTFSSVKLGVDGVPIFSSPTVGELTVNQTYSTWNVSFQYQVGAGNQTVPEINCDCGGSVRLHVFNRFYPQQTIAYENGALIRAQADGQVVRGEPGFQVLVSNTTQIDFTLVHLFGTGGVSGVGSESLSSRVVGVDLQEYVDVVTDVIVNYTGQYGPAWYGYFNATLGAAFGVTANDFATDPMAYQFSRVFLDGRLTITLLTPVYEFSLNWNPLIEAYTLEMTIFNDANDVDPDVLRVSAFRLLHAYANVAAGERGNQVGL